MTRREREITNQDEINEILEDCKYLHLGLVDDGMPYVVPLNYGLDRADDGHLIVYLHGATTGRKLDIIKANSNCCFTMERMVQPFEGRMACQYGVAYECIMGTGKIHIVTDENEKMHALVKLMETQTGRVDFEFDSRMVSIVSVMRIDADTLTAKRRPLPEQLQEKENANRKLKERKVKSENVGLKIKARREELGMSILQAAKKAHVCRATWERYEKGLPVRSDKYEKVCYALDLIERPRN